MHGLRAEEKEKSHEGEMKQPVTEIHTHKKKEKEQIDKSGNIDRYEHTTNESNTSHDFLVKFFSYIHSM